jgi:hypothetical protein
MSQSKKSSNPRPEKSLENSTSAPIETAFIKNWKTTAIGIILSFTGFVAFSPNTFGGEQATLVKLCRYVATGGLATLGIVSKDFNAAGRG